ncbi:MAG: PhoU domain-containing protein, partial [Oscillibacter sp.]
RMVRSENPARSFAFLYPRLMRTPGVAINECVNITNQMGELAHHNLLLALQQLSSYSDARETELAANEDKLDIYEDRLGNYLVEISQHGVSMDDMHTVSRLLHAIGDFERIGDHAVNLQESARELSDKDLKFSDAAAAELELIASALQEILDRAIGCFIDNAPDAAILVEPLEETIDRLIDEVRTRHIARLQQGRCTIQLGFVLSDLLTNFERVSDHCSNLAVCVIEAAGGDVARHAYLQDLKSDGTFNETLRLSLEKYHLPKE